ncbi:protein translocase subunit SecD [Protaetiibacter sp. SSC-01]|uniref:protein translocase subunit SecD n=1 Tax=Protaetiibacter sp. SSC-01 TaxID=2759943 RepID=UPI0016570C7A|nr:protein translocase subunit SecD [Protaetiibacter sp. SSC-01]QNO36406.1 protein translocase subunit SecD [Protaetiibacter sp. SSC-01]
MAARSTPVRKAWRSLGWLAGIIVLLVGLNTAGALWWGWGWAPKLALDLDGGTQIILTPTLEDGQQVTDEQLQQSVQIIRDRIDAAGVSESEITTQGGDKIVISIPGKTPDQATLDRIKQSARMDFRAVLLAGAPTSSVVTPTDEPSDGSTADPAATDAPADPEATDAPAQPEVTETPAPAATPTADPTDGSDLAWVTPELQEQYDAFSCDQLDSATASAAPSAEPLITCDQYGQEKYLLGPVEVQGGDISDATAGIRTTSTGVSTGEWIVNLTFNGDGTEAFSKVTKRLVNLESPRNRFAVVLDGAVVLAPSANDPINDGRAQISGGFTQESSKVLADQLKFGALPVGFTVESTDTISATLGQTQLQSGLIAGLIGLILVFIYSLFQYRLLGTVTIASLIVAGVITYFVVNIMSWREGYRLSLAGIAGLIVAIGFTADSFIVYFERIRDELRDGRSLVGAVEAGWKRALRTVLAAKSVNLLSAIILFVLAVGSVRGFALTLGVTTIIDVIIVILFTHPMMQLLATTKFFASGHPASGLDPTALGAVYRGRAEFRVTKDARRAGASREAERRQTIAERKAAELEASAATGPKKNSTGKKEAR